MQRSLFLSTRKKWWFSLFLSVIFFLSTVAPSEILAAGMESLSPAAPSSFVSKTQDPDNVVSDVADSVYANAGGWGLKSALIFSASSAIKEYYQSRDDGRTYQIGNVFDFLKMSQFWGGLVGDLALTMAVTAIAPAIPGGIFVQTLAIVGAGFVGYELGSGNIAHSDWVSIGFGTLAATVTQIGLSSLLAGLPLAGIIAGVASIGVALGVAYFIGKLRERNADGEGSHEKVRGQHAPTIETLPEGNNGEAFVRNRRSSASDLVSLEENRDAAYKRFIKACKAGESSQKLSALLDEYRRWDRALHTAQKFDSRAGVQ